MKLSQYSKAVAALLGGLAAAGVLLPAGAPAWMLAAVPVVTAVAAVVAAPRNADKPAVIRPRQPTKYQRIERPGGHPSGDTPASQLKPPATGTREARFPRGPGGGDPPPPV